MLKRSHARHVHTLSYMYVIVSSGRVLYTYVFMNMRCVTCHVAMGFARSSR